MDPLTAALVVLLLVVAATVAGVIGRRRAGRVRAADGETVTAAGIGTDALGRRATLVQFSTEYCAPCRATRTMLAPLAAERPGVALIDVDLSVRPELAGRFGITQTPTVLLVDGSGWIRARVGGAPRRHELVARLDDLLKEHRVTA